MGRSGQGVAKTRVADPAASKGEARRGLQNGVAGALVAGAYATLPPGTFALHFWLRVSDNGSDQRIGVIDVIDATGGELRLASREIKASDFAPTAQYQSCDLKIVLTGATPVEMRVWFEPGIADLWVDRIEVEPASETAERGDSLDRSGLANRN